MKICEIQLSWWIVLNIISEKYFKIWEDMGTKRQQLRHLSCHCWKWAHKADNKCVQGFWIYLCLLSMYAEFMGSVWDERRRETWERLILTKVNSPQRLNIKLLNLEEKYVLRKPLMVEGWLGDLSRSKRRWYSGGAFYIRGLSWSVMKGFLPPRVKPSSVKCRIVTS